MRHLITNAVNWIFVRRAGDPWDESAMTIAIGVAAIFLSAVNFIVASVLLVCAICD